MDVIQAMEPHQAEKWNNKNELNPYFTNVTGATPEPVLCKNFYLNLKIFGICVVLC